MDKSIRRVGSEIVLLGNIYILPESKSTVNEIQRELGEVAVDVQNYKRQGEVVSMRCYTSRIGKPSNPNENIGQYGEVIKNTNGAEMLMFLKKQRDEDVER